MISTISDIHIKNVNDEPYKLFLNFLENDLVKRSDKIFLLGDVFDLLVGGDQRFFDEFKEVFTKIEKLLSEGKHIYYVEGNQDFHLEKFFRKYLNHQNFHLVREKMYVREGSWNIMLCHGDDIEIENPSYEQYSAFIKSKGIKLLAEYIVPFSFTRRIGNWASAKSRKKNIERYEKDNELIKDKFRRSAELAYHSKKPDVIVAGHSHLKDNYNSKAGFLYLNNGYVPKEKVFINIDNENFKFIEL